MSATGRTDMNTHKQSHKMIFSFAGIAFLLLSAFPQTLWASGQDGVGLNRFLEVLELVLSSQSGGSRQKYLTEKPYYQENERYREYRPAVNKYYRDSEKFTYYGDQRNPGHYRQHSRKHHRSKHRHCNENRHRQQYYDEYSWR